MFLRISSWSLLLARALIRALQITNVNLAERKLRAVAFLSTVKWVMCACCVVAASLAVTAGGHAAEFRLRDDSVVFGRVLRLNDGKDLVVDTAHMGEVTLEWDALVGFDETGVVEIEFYDGRMVLGSIALNGGTLTISGDTALTVNPADVVSISEIKSGFWDALDTHVDLGLNVVRGNSRVTQLRLAAGFAYDVPGTEVTVNTATYSNEQPNAADTRRTTLSAAYTKFLERNWSAIGLYEFEADEQQNLDSRSVLGAALGKTVINNRAQRLELFAGFALNSEDFEASSTRETSEAALGIRYRLRSDADIDATLINYQNIEHSDQYRVQFDASLNVELTGDFNLNLTAYDRYNSDPPEGTSANDYGLLLGLRWTQ